MGSYPGTSEIFLLLAPAQVNERALQCTKSAYGVTLAPYGPAGDHNQGCSVGSVIRVMGKKPEMTPFSRRQMLTVAAGSAMATTWPQWARARDGAGDVAGSPNIVRGIDATYDMKILSTGEIFGHEHWSLYVHPDGSRTLSVRLINNDYKLFRSIIHRVDADFRPLECQLLYYRDGARMGSAWFQIDRDTLTAEAVSERGRLYHTVAVPQNFSMVNHAAAAEGWHFWYCPKDGRPHQATLYNLRVNAKEAEGVLGRVHTRTIQHLAEEDVETPAGTFACDHYAFGDPSRVWVYGQDRMPVWLRFEQADREFVVSRWDVMT